MHMSVEEEEEKTIDNDNNMIADFFVIVEKSYIFLIDYIEGSHSVR